MKKYKWFQDKCNILGTETEEGVTHYAYPKDDIFTKLEKPNKWGDLSILIGTFGLYRQLFP